MKRRVIGAAALVLTAAAVVVCLLLWKTPPSVQSSQALLSLAETLDTSKIDCTFSPSEKKIRVSQTLTLCNREEITLDTLVLRSWPNAFQSQETSPASALSEQYRACYPDGFSVGALTVDHLRIDGQPARHHYDDDAKTVLTIPIENGWQPGQVITAEIDYHLYFPHVIWPFGWQEGSFSAANAFLVPSVYADGRWRTESYPPVSSPFTGVLMNWDVTVTAPEGWQCAGTGYPETHESDGQTVFHFVSPCVRDFAMALSNQWQMAQKQYDDLLITVYAKEASAARDMLGDACEALSYYQQQYGVYPYPCFTLCQLPLSKESVSYPQFAIISSSAAEKEEREHAVLFETAQQWWRCIVGTDGCQQPWQDKALSQFSYLKCYEHLHGQAAAEEKEARLAGYAMRVSVPRGITPGAPLDRFFDESIYRLVVYDRGLAMMCALDDLLSGRLDACLRSYYETYSFRTASRSDFETLLAKVSGQDVSPLICDYLDTYILN